VHYCSTELGTCIPQGEAQLPMKVGVSLQALDLDVCANLEAFN
jgi:hypothetical protein